MGELAHGLQAKLLRVLQQREFERVGGSQPHPLDIRVIAATNRELAEDVRDGRFREDLYHRLNVVTLHSAPLRDRHEDIPVLAQFFLRRSAERCKRQVEGLTKEAEQMLTQYSWPGNVRELENAMERAVVLGVSDWVLPEDLPETLLESAPRDASAKYHLSVGQAKRESILEAYAQGGGDYKAAAKILGLHPNYLLRLVRNMGLRDDINRQRRNSGAVGRWGQARSVQSRGQHPLLCSEFLSMEQASGVHATLGSDKWTRESSLRRLRSPILLHRLA